MLLSFGETLHSAFQCGEPRSAKQLAGATCAVVVVVVVVVLAARPQTPAEIAAKMVTKLTVADIAKVFEALGQVCVAVESQLNPHEELPLETRREVSKLLRPALSGVVFAGSVGAGRSRGPTVDKDLAPKVQSACCLNGLKLLNVWTD